MKLEASFLRRTWFRLIYFDFKLRRKPIDQPLLWRSGGTCWQKTRLSSAKSLRVTNAWLPTDNWARQDVFNDFSRLSSRTTRLVLDDCQATAERATDLEPEGIVCISESDVANPDRLIKQAAILMRKLNKKCSAAKIWQAWWNIQRLQERGEHFAMEPTREMIFPADKAESSFDYESAMEMPKRH